MTFTRRLARAQMILGALAVLVGAAGFIEARHVAFTADRAPFLGSASYSVQAMSFNRTGALIVIALGLIAIAAAAAGKPPLGWIPGLGFAILAAQVLVQWRGHGTNWVASAGSNLSFSLLLAVGFTATAGLARAAAQIDANPDQLPQA